MWEMTKLKIREQSLKYSTIKTTKISRDEEELEKEINNLQRLVESNNIEDEDKKDTLHTLDAKKLELEKIIEHKNKRFNLAS